MATTVASQSRIAAAVSEELSRPSTARYFKEQFANPLLIAVYDDLSAIARHNYLGTPSSNLLDHLHVEPASGFLPRLAHQIVSTRARLTKDPRFQEVATSSIEDIFCRWVRDDVDRFLTASRTEVARLYDPTVASSLLGYFLSDLIHRVLVRESTEHLPPEARHRLKEESRRRANNAIEAYSATAQHGSKPRTRDFFRYALAHPQWLLKEVVR